ncbi:MAG: N-acetylmannosamine-6-phosphate 2-epimerase [Clostridia bacterium]|nr:N-acetylmannosamine-6-phosphate 2-epimerase [Clostridia bacterium]MDY6184485.1 N-acetylmannosamine-6-phosphate 2-epimerase [Eubacteriales bacterium]
MAIIQEHGLVASCQAVEGEPLFGYGVMPVMAKACVAGGACAIRTSSVDDILGVRKAVSVPVIGLIKRKYSDSEIYITPTLREVKEILATGCEVIALDATDRARPAGETLEELVAYIRRTSPQTEIMADIATISEAIHAQELGFDYINSTLRGYTSETAGIAIPDMAFLAEMTSTLSARVIAEGGVWEVSQLQQVLETGVYAVVIGSAITRPKDITHRFHTVLEKFYS